MEILSDRVGILLKYGKVMGGLTKRYFFIDNSGILYYMEKDNYILELLRSDSYENDRFISIVKPHSKLIHLHDCSVSGIKNFLEDKFDLRGRSYFEIFVKDRDYRSIILLSLSEEFINSLLEYVGTFREGEVDEEVYQDPNGEQNEMEIINERQIINKNMFATNEKGNSDSNFMQEFTGAKSLSVTSNIFSNARDKKFMDIIVSKLGGKLVNQKDWDKEFIKVVNPSSNLIEYEETWVELENGSNYSGPVKNGMPHGFGKEYRPDGSLYTGYFNKGKWHGPGTLTNDSLDTYQGEFIDGCICGI
jgi:hypothetical protein